MAHPLAVTAGAALVIAHASRVNLRRRHRLRQPMGHPHCTRPWKASGVGARCFCRTQGLAVSTFVLWRKEFASETPSMAHPLAVTAAATLATAHDEGEPAATPPSAPADAP